MARSVVNGVLPAGVRVIDLEMHRDDRGVFTELYRASWLTGPTPIQWNLVSSVANVLRGVHVHLRHHDYLVFASGRARVGLRDLRPETAERGAVATLELSGDELVAVTVPPGVAHGFFFYVPSVHVYSVSEYWDPDDELGCRWDDADLGIPWPVEDPLISERDASLPSLKDLQSQLAGASFAG